MARTRQVKHFHARIHLSSYIHVGLATQIAALQLKRGGGGVSLRSCLALAAFLHKKTLGKNKKKEKRTFRDHHHHLIPWQQYVRTWLSMAMSQAPSAAHLVSASASLAALAVFELLK